MTAPPLTAELDRLADDFWDAVLASDPTQGTAIGDHRYGDRLSDISPEGSRGTDRAIRGDRARPRRATAAGG